MMADRRDVLSPETYAVLACAQAVVRPRLRERARAAVGACASPERLCEVAARHGMVGHLHKLIAADGETADSEAVNGETADGGAGEGGAAYAVVREPLAALYRVSAERALRQTGQLLRLLEALEARGIETLPIKGPAWAERLYGDVTLRNWVDLDLIVRYDDAAAAHEALLELGLLDSSPYSAQLLRRRTRTEGEIAMHSADNDLLVDLHWQIGVGYGPEALTGQRLLDQATQGTLLGRPVRALSSADMLLLTCLHGTRHEWDSVEALLSLAVQVDGTPPEDWPALLAAAREAGCQRRVLVGVGHACRAFGLPVPDAVRDGLRTDALARALVASLRPDSLSESRTRSRSRQLTVLLWNAVTEDALLTAVEHGALRALRPGPEDWESYALPAGMSWLYWPLRPLRLAVKWARRALAAAAGR
jgi:hypothetical protein